MKKLPDIVLINDINGGMKAQVVLEVSIHHKTSKSDNGALKGKHLAHNNRTSMSDSAPLLGFHLTRPGTPVQF